MYQKPPKYNLTPVIARNNNLNPHRILTKYPEQGLHYGSLIDFLYCTIQFMQPTPEAYKEWQEAYDEINQRLFLGTLPPCLITFQREKNTMGYFSHRRFANRKGQKTDEIALNPAYFASAGIHEALQTLAHEMVHLWQQHFGQPGRGRYHNKEWADKMESIGLMPSHTGEPGGMRTGDRMSDYIMADGEFEGVIDVLVNNGFELKWMDRHVASAQQTNTAITATAQITSEALEAEIGITPELAHAIDPDLSRVIQQKQGNRSKYTCPGCSVNLWGKPALNIECADCKELFGEI